MHSVHTFRSLAILSVLALLLAAPWPVQAAPADAPRAEATAGPIHLFIDWLAGLWGKNGCTFDPNGLCRETATTESPSGTAVLDNGCTFDPSGLCRETATTESPSGTAVLDNGCTFDPDGAPCRDSR